MRKRIRQLTAVVLSAALSLGQMPEQILASDETEIVSMNADVDEAANDFVDDFVEDEFAEDDQKTIFNVNQKNDTSESSVLEELPDEEMPELEGENGLADFEASAGNLESGYPEMNHIEESISDFEMTSAEIQALGSVDFLAEEEAGGSCGTDLTWSLDTEGVFTISGTGSMTSYSQARIPWYSKRSSIRKIVVEEGVTSITQYAFQNTTALQSVSLPSTLTAIGNYAFSGSSLETIVLPEAVTTIGNYAFSGGSLSSIILPEALTTIGTYAFSASNLKTIVLPESVTSLGNYAFYNCGSLERVSMSDGVKSIGTAVFRNCTALKNVMLGDAVTSLGQYAFGGCSSMSEFVMPDSLTSIGSYAFSGCSSLRTIQFSQKLTTINSYAFQNCTALTEVALPAAITTVNAAAFDGCSNLSTVSGIDGNLTWILDRGSHTLTISGNGNMKVHTSGSHGSWAAFEKEIQNVIIQSGITDISSYTFYNCTALENISLSDTVTSLGNYSFRGCSGLTEINFSASLTSIGSYAFTNCTSLSEIRLPERMTSLGTYAFSGCSQLSKVYLPSSLSSVAAYAFGTCTLLTEIEIPDGMTSIDSNAFNGCTALEKITIPESVTSIGAYAFNKCTALTIYGYTGSQADKFAEEKGIPFVSIGQGSSDFRVISGELGENIEWTYYIPTKTLTLSGSGAAEKSGSTLPWATYSNEVTEIVVENGITELGNSLFYGMKAVERVTLPEQLIKIGDSAFGRCSSLYAIQLPDTVSEIGKYAFDNCEKLEEIVIPEAVTEIKMDTFLRCSSLRAVHLGSHVESIGAHAFSECKVLENLLLPNGVKTIGASAFSYCEKLEEMILPSTVTELDWMLFANCTSLKSIKIQAAIQTIPRGLFSGCTSLIQVEFPESVQSFEREVFANCSSLTAIHLPEAVTEISDSLFYGCTSLSEIIFSDQLSRIGDNAFKNCSSLTAIMIPETLVEFGSNAFSGCTSLKDMTLRIREGMVIGEGLFSGAGDGNLRITISGKIEKLPNKFFANSGVKSVVLDDSIKIIGTEAFSKCEQLTDVVMNGVTTIYTSAFVGTKNLETIQMKNIQEIGMYAFDGSGILLFDSDQFPKLQSIQSYAFQNCSNLQKVVLKGNPDLGNGIFYNCQALKEIDLPDLTILPNGMFQKSKALTSVYLPSVKEIVNSAFENSGLREISAPVAEVLEYSAFYGCSALERVSFPKAREIRSFCFKNSTSLTEIHLPEAENVENNAFSGCSSLKIVDIPNLRRITSYLFADCVSLEEAPIPEGVTAIERNAFSGCTALRRADLPAMLTEIGDYAFKNCAITEIHLPEQLRSIGKEAFAGCQISEITIPSLVKKIGEDVLKDDIALRELTVNAESVQALGSSLAAPFKSAGTAENGLVVRFNGKSMPEYFLYASHVKEIIFGENVKSIGRHALSSNTFTSVILPEGIEKLGDFAFSSTYLETINLPDSLLEVGNGCFYATALFRNLSEENHMKIYDHWLLEYSGEASEIELPEGVAGIANAVFKNKTLTKVVFPESLDRIGAEAFRNNKNLGTVVVSGRLRHIGMNAFDGTAWSSSGEMRILEGVNGDYFLGCTNSGSTLILPENVKYIVAGAGTLDPNLELLICQGEIEGIEEGALIGSKAHIQFQEPMSIFEIMEKYGYKTFQGSGMIQEIADSWYSAGGEVIGLPDQVISYHGDTMISLAARVMARNIMERENISSVKEAYDWLCSNCGYVYTVGWHDSYADGPFLYRRASCLGYAYAMKAFLDELGMINCIVTGYCYGDDQVVRSHAWNEVLVGSTWYVIDATDTFKGDYTTYMITEEAAKNMHYTFVEDYKEEAQKRYEVVENSSQPLSFSLQGDGTYWVTDCMRGAENVVIPFTYNGKKVSGIGEAAFKDCAWLESIVIPEGITTIGAEAFSNCIGLKEITFPSTVTSVGWGAFLSCVQLKKADLSKTKITEIPYALFLGSLSLCEARFPLTVTQISDNCMAKQYLNSTEGRHIATIYGAAGSEVERYAKSKDFAFISTGTMQTEPEIVLDKPVLGSISNLSAGIKLTWEKVSNADGYEIYRTVYGKNAYEKAGTISNGSTLTFTDTGVVCGTTYTYYIQAYAGNVTSVKSNTKSYRFLSLPKITETRNLSSGIELNWEKITGAAGYYVYRRGSSKEDWKQIADLTGSSVVSYIDTEVAVGETWYYALRAYHKTTSGTIYQSSRSTSGTKVVREAVLVLEKPVISAISNLSAGVKLTWGKVANAEGYEIYRTVYGKNSYSLIGTVNSGATVTFTDTTAKNATSYTYKIKACAGDVSSVYSSTKTYRFITMPTNIKVKNLSSGLKVTWDEVAGATGYYVYRRGSSSADWSLVRTITEGTTVSYTNTAVKENYGSTYYYTVRAYYTASSGNIYTSSRSTSGTKMVRVRTAGTVTLSNTSTGIKVTWSQVDGASGYYVYRKAETEAEYKLMRTVTDPTTLSYTNTTAKNGMAYSYKVSAYVISSSKEYEGAAGAEKMIVRLD